jgi:hypothetical protein
MESNVKDDGILSPDRETATGDQFITPNNLFNVNNAYDYSEDDATREETEEKRPAEGEIMMEFDNIDQNDVDDDDESVDRQSDEGSNEGSDGSVETDNEDEDEDSNRAWSADNFDYNNLKVSFEDISETLKHKLRESIEHLRDRIEMLEKSMSFASDVDCSELRNFVVFANVEFWQHLIIFLNKNRTDAIEPVDGFAITKFVRCILWCAYYRKSPGHMIENKSLFPAFTKEIRLLGGKQRFAEIKYLFKSPKRQLNSSWDNYFSLIPDIRKLVRLVSENCSAIAFGGTPNDITIDDDKWRFRSSNWSELGYSRRKGLKSFGCVLNMACDCPTGLFVSGAITSFGETATNSTKVILQRALHVETTDEVLMEGAMIHGDRGYNDDAFLRFCSKINASLFFTVKRGPTLPYSFGSTAYRCNIDQQVIPENGCQTAYLASRLIDGNKLFFTGYRNGTGRVVFFATSAPNLAGTKWSIVLQKQCERRKYLSPMIERDYIDYGEDASADVVVWKEVFCTDQALNELTESQGTPEWFLLRKFSITSTVAKAVLDMDDDRSPEDKDWMRNNLGIQFRDAIDEPTIEDADYAAMSFPELIVKGKKELMEICKSLGHRTSGNKKDMVNRIKTGVNTQRANHKSDLEKLAKCWFLKPLVKKASLKMGSVNERFVLRAVKNIGVYNPDIHVLAGPYEFGLVRRKDKPWLATSVDGVVALNIGDAQEFNCAIEIKTMTFPHTVAEARAIAAQHTKVMLCSFGDDVFKKCLKPEYRVQCLHHACVMGLNCVLFIVASGTNIIYYLLICMEDEDTARYEKLLDPMKESLNWVYGDAPFPQEGFGDGLLQNGYHVDVHSVRLQLALWKSTHDFIAKHEMRPLPRCKYIVPSGIAYWNKTKGFVDVMSRLLSHIKIPFQKGGPVLQLIFRFISIMVVNGHLTSSLLKLTQEDFDNEDSYNDIRKRMSNSSTLNDFVKILATHFELPGCMYDVNSEHNVRDDDDNEQTAEGIFSKLPMNRKLRQQEINTFKKLLVNKRKLGVVFNEGLPKKIRLDCSYSHNMVPATGQGRCVLCTLKKKESWPKYKCKTCGVFLCRTPPANGRLSCEEKWHSNNDLTK